MSSIYEATRDKDGNPLQGDGEATRFSLYHNRGKFYLSVNEVIIKHEMGMICTTYKDMMNGQRVDIMEGRNTKNNRLKAIEMAKLAIELSEEESTKKLFEGETA